MLDCDRQMDGQIDTAVDSKYSAYVLHHKVTKLKPDAAAANDSMHINAVKLTSHLHFEMCDLSVANCLKPYSVDHILIS